MYNRGVSYMSCYLPLYRRIKTDDIIMLVFLLKGCPFLDISIRYADISPQSIKRITDYNLLHKRGFE